MRQPLTRCAHAARSVVVNNAGVLHGDLQLDYEVAGNVIANNTVGDNGARAAAQRGSSRRRLRRSPLPLGD